jgi:hypothetical protein
MLFISCTSKEQSPVESRISRDAQPVISGTYLFAADSSHYFREMELTEHFCFFVDTKHEETLHAYTINDFTKPCPPMLQENPLNQRILLSFYDLKGVLLSTVQCGSDTIVPIAHAQEENKIDVLKSTKCFIYLYGTEEYLYCLYAGTADYSEPSKIMLFRWNGSHVKTWQMDRHIRSIAVEQSDDYIMAIALNKEGGQDVIRYATGL